jgi:hypothetical protein
MKSTVFSQEVFVFELLLADTTAVTGWRLTSWHGRHITAARIEARNFMNLKK